MAEAALQPSIRDLRALALLRLMARLGQIDPRVVQTLDPDQVPDAALPALAWGWGLLGPVWEVLESPAARRAYLRDAFLLQSRRGTGAAVERALFHAGFTGATVLEQQDALRYDDQAAYDGEFTYGGGFDHWWEFGLDLVLAPGEAFSAERDALARRVALAFAPVRSRLVRVELDLGETHSSVGGPLVGDIRVGLSPDGVAWFVQEPFIVPRLGGLTYHWRITGDEGVGLDLTRLALLREDGSVALQVSRPPIHVTPGLEVYGSWSLSWGFPA